MRCVGGTHWVLYGRAIRCGTLRACISLGQPSTTGWNKGCWATCLARAVWVIPPTSHVRSCLCAYMFHVHHVWSGMDWHDLEVLIRDERRAGNPVASLIHSLQVWFASIFVCARVCLLFYLGGGCFGDALCLPLRGAMCVRAGSGGWGCCECERGAHSSSAAGGGSGYGAPRLI